MQVIYHSSSLRNVQSTVLPANENKILLMWETHGQFGSTSEQKLFFYAHAVGECMKTGRVYHLCARVLCADSRAWTLYLLNQQTNYWAELTAGKQSCLSESFSQWQAFLAVTANTCRNVSRRGHICFSSNIYKQYIYVSCRFVSQTI